MDQLDREADMRASNTNLVLVTAIVLACLTLAPASVIIRRDIRQRRLAQLDLNSNQSE